MISLKKILVNLFYIFFPLAVGFLSSVLAQTSNGLYVDIIKPPLAPPSILFPIVWTILYLLIGISYYLLKKNTDTYDVSNASFWYYLQLIINFFWSIFFFRNQAFTFSFIWLVFLIITVIVTIRKCYDLYKPSAYLLIPYLIWILFAGYLNLAIAILN